MKAHTGDLDRVAADTGAGVDAGHGDDGANAQVSRVATVVVGPDRVDHERHRLPEGQRGGFDSGEAGHHRTPSGSTTPKPYTGLRSPGRDRDRRPRPQGSPGAAHLDRLHPASVPAARTARGVWEAHDATRPERRDASKAGVPPPSRVNSPSRTGTPDGATGG
ncbi:MAG: hypothetical protein U5R31_00970 [Acidimicrobiia bacterium]|nr:hypothetical protein [Acidimicrobiia bacterium]